MPRNIEIKARIDFGAQPLTQRASALAWAAGGDGTVVQIDQDDSFFAAPRGRLKLRRFGDGSGELIQYERADTTAAKASDYMRVPLPDAPTADALHAALARSLGELGRVRKRRWVVLMPHRLGHTRVHLDRVESLGEFIELEVVLHAEQTDAEGAAIADALMHELGLADAPRIAGAYLDLLRTAAAERG